MLGDFPYNVDSPWYVFIKNDLTLFFLSLNLVNHCWSSIFGSLFNLSIVNELSKVQPASILASDSPSFSKRTFEEGAGGVVGILNPKTSKVLSILLSGFF